VYIAEVAPFASRGGLAYLFQVATTVGILAAQLVNYGTQYIPDWGWRLSLGLAAMPASILCLGGLVLPESPSYLIEKWVPPAAPALRACTHVPVAVCVCIRMQAVLGLHNVCLAIDLLPFTGAISAPACTKHVPWLASLATQAVCAGLSSLSRADGCNPNILRLLRRGKWSQGKAILQKLRGTDEVDAEYADICDAAQQAAKTSNLQV
jgi:MFS family permease